MSANKTDKSDTGADRLQARDRLQGENEEMRHMRKQELNEKRQTGGIYDMDKGPLVF